MSTSPIQPIAMRSGLPLAGLPAAVPFVADAHRAWDERTALRIEGPFEPTAVAGYQVGLRTNDLRTDDLPKNSTNPFDFRVTTRGIPV